MQEIKCPKCGTVIQVEESDYQNIVLQVRDKEFNKEVNEKEARFAAEKEAALKLQKVEVTADYERKLAEKENELRRVSEVAKAEMETLKLKAKADFDAERARAQAELVALKTKKDAEIAELNNKISVAENDKKLAITEAIAEKDKHIAEKDNTITGLNLRIENAELTRQNDEKSLKDYYELQLKAKDEEVAFYKDFKLKLSTKALGESLEKYCENEFNKLRATGFKNAYFEKDNNAKSGSKGDYIFKDKTPGDDIEYISIMFEMKNEADMTATKHKNEDFFSELDKDRREKKCEYAVLVSVLEPESELYNSGIVDVSHAYEKMYVIRPQFFIPMITLLRNAAQNSISIRRDLILAQSQSIDITNFENKMNDFKEKFGYNCQQTVKKFNSAIDEIDKAINYLQKVRDDLTGANRNLELANNRAEDLSIKKLTWNNPTMKQKFESARQADECVDGKNGVESE